MTSAAVCFLTGNLLVMGLPVYLDVIGQFAFLLTLLPVALYGVTRKATRDLGAGTLGIVFTFIAAENLQRQSLPQHLEGRDIYVEVQVTGLPTFVEAKSVDRKRVDEKRVREGTRFRARARHIDADPAFSDARLLLTWYDAPTQLVPGERWVLPVRLNRRNGSLNPGLFDYEAWLFAEQIGARGYVRNSDDVVRLGTHRDPVSRLRLHVRNALIDAAPLGTSPGLLFALVLGDTTALTPGEWHLVTGTGVIHLLIISGLHIGLVAWLVHTVTGILGFRMQNRLGVSLVVASAYALLAGFGLPVQRALVMLTVVIACQLLRRRVALNDQLGIAMLCCLLIDPFAALRRGFWLSFLAVALLMLFMGLKRPAVGQISSSPLAFVRESVRAQWIIFFGMAPVLLIGMGQVSLVSFLVNLVAIPFVGLVLVPCLLVFASIAVLLPWLSVHMTGVIAGLSNAVWLGLSWSIREDMMLHALPGPMLQLFLSFSGGLVLLLPRIAGLTLPALLALVSGLPAGSPAAWAPGVRAEIRFLDVGQGLAVLIMSRHQVTVYDTGPAFGSRFNSGSQVVVPSLRQAGRKTLDNLIISHGDNDHAGGVDAVLDAFDLPRRIATPRSCEGSWQADGIHYRLIGSQFVGGSSNNLSCLLRISSGNLSVLLTGDIEVEAEMSILGQLEPVTILSVPHHGSETSSSPAFLNRVMPDVAVTSNGYRNRFGHPSSKIRQRYSERHVRWYDTAVHGAITIYMFDDHFEVKTRRQETIRLWRRL